MKVLTETGLRTEFKNKFPETYTIDSKVLVTPSAKQYLKEKKVKLVVKEDRGLENQSATPIEINKVDQQEKQVNYKYKCYYTGGLFEKKPEHMTQLHGNYLVSKNHPRIQLRGKLDSFQAEVLEVQILLNNRKENKLLEDLTEVLTFVRNLLRAEVLEEPFDQCVMLGMDEGQLREMSHNPKKFLNVEHFLPNYSMGSVLIKLNSLRSAARELEIVGVKAFTKGNGEVERIDIMQALNRLSSCLYIMMCRWQGGHYK